MKYEKLDKVKFNRLLSGIDPKALIHEDFLHRCYEDAVEGINALTEQNELMDEMIISPIILLTYIKNEHFFYLTVHKEKNVEELLENPEYERVIISIATDKYFTNEHLAFQTEAFASRFSPTISTINLYLNFIQGILNNYNQGFPVQTLIVDVMKKGFNMCNCIATLLTNGYETEAFSTWRTLHENECILHVLIKYGQPVMDKYLKHIKYAIAFRGGFDKEKTDEIFVDIKSELKGYGLKSKDMKRFIEYGWLYGIPNCEEIEGFKLNFRDGVERCAGLREYSKVYEMSSEIAHSSPLLIYSKKNYFYLVTMLNLHESFFRLEKIFTKLYLCNCSPEDQNKYIKMRELYYSELVAVYEYEKKNYMSMMNNGPDEIATK